MGYKNILFEVEERVSTITFNRPRALNSITTETLSELNDALVKCRDEDEIQVVIITGAGKAFVAGADIQEMKDLEPYQAMEFTELGHRNLRLIETLPKPVIAMVNGMALGGGTEISMACDIRFASENAQFGQPEITLGVIPGWGGTQRLARLVGLGRAKELVLSGEHIDANRAYEIGLVNRVFPADQLADETRKFAQKLAGMPAFALKLAKHSMNYGYDMSLESANALENECFAQCFGTQDQKEGMQAFLEKRKAKFVGH